MFVKIRVVSSQSFLSSLYRSTKQIAIARNTDFKNVASKCVHVDLLKSQAMLCHNHKKIWENVKRSMRGRSGIKNLTRALRLLCCRKRGDDEAGAGVDLSDMLRYIVAADSFIRSSP